MAMTKKDKLMVQITSIVYLSMVFLCAQALWQRGAENIPAIYVLNIGIDLFGMLAGYMLFIACIVDVQKSGSDLKWFIYMINTTIWWLFTDAGAWLIDGIPELRTLNIIDNTLLFMCAPLSAFVFWKYITGMIPMNRTFEKVLDKAVQYGVIIPIAMRIINLFTGMYFTVDENGVYQRGSLYVLCLLYALFVLGSTAAVIITERKHLQTYRVVAAALYILTPFLSMIVNVLVYGISVNAAITMLVTLLMYCVLNVSQGREKAAADRDLAVASSIQTNILPKTFPYLPERKEFDLYATMTPAKEVGGDFYDFFMIDDDHIAIVIADVSGKGMPAALFMMVARTIIKNQTQAASLSKDPKEILAEVNNQLCDGNKMEMFVTAWLGIITLSTGHIEYASAGHEYPAISMNGRDFFILKEKNSPPLATMEGLKYRGGELDLNKGDTIFIYTDGVAEATNSEGELFGNDRMLEALNLDIHAELNQIDTRVRGAIDTFVGDAPQFDDITMLTFRYNGAEVDTEETDSTESEPVEVTSAEVGTAESEPAEAA